MNTEINTENSVWDNVQPENGEEREFVNFAENENKVKLTFETDHPRVGENKFGKTTYYFDVIEHDMPKVMSVTSMRLMNELKERLPLQGKILEIERVGEGYDTHYRVNVE